jgi:hypothetical protein
MKHLPFTQLDTNETYTASVRILDIVKQDLADDPYVKSMIPLLIDGTTGMERAMGRILKSEFTTLLKKKDEIRDHYFIGLRDHLSSQTHNLKNEEMMHAATKLYAVIEELGVGLYYLGLVDETAKLNALLSSFKSTENMSLLTLTGAADWFSYLADAQEDFETTYNSKIGKDATVDIPLIRVSKDSIKRNMTPLLGYIQTNALINPSVFKPVEEGINIVITDIVTIARARKTREESEKKDKKKKGKQPNDDASE